MPKVFYSGQARTSPPAERQWSSDGTGSEAETDVEFNGAIGKGSNSKQLHRRTESMDIDAQQSVQPKRVRKIGNAVIRQRQASRELRDATGQRPLQKACARGDTERVLALLENGPDLQDRDYAGTTALHTAALQGDTSIVEALLKAGAVPDVRSGPEELDTPLMDAAANGFLPIVELLLKSGADPRISNAMGRIALDFVDSSDEESAAIKNVLTKRTNELRRQGKPVITSPTDKKAPQGLYPPGFSGIQRPAAPMFLDVTKRSTRSEIVEHAAAGDLEYVGFALERGWRPTPDALTKAAKYGHTEVVGLLLAFGLDANTSVNGATPLEEAIQRSHLSTVKLLIDSGAKLKPEYKRHVSDLPAWDELRAFVTGIKPEDKPVSQTAPSPDINAYSGATASSGATATATATAFFKHGVASTSEPDPPTVPLGTLESPPTPTPIPDYITQKTNNNKFETNGQVALVPSVNTPTAGKFEETTSGSRKPSLPSEPRLSRIDLKSIKPKKRSKSTVSIPTTHHDTQSTNEPSSIGSVSADGSVVNSPNLSEPALKENSQPSHKFSKPTPVPEPFSTRTTPLAKKASIDDIMTKSVESESAKQKMVSDPSASDPSVETQAAPPSRSGSPATEVDSGHISASKENIREIWAERSQELNELAERKAKERRDREARMLESLAREERRRSDSQMEATELKHEPPKPEDSIPLAESSPCSDLSPNDDGHTPSLNDVPGHHDIAEEQSASRVQSPLVQTPVKVEEQQPLTLLPQQAEKSSVTQLPWILRRLAYTGKPQFVAPLLDHIVAEKHYFVDVQVALLAGEPQLHKKYPQLTKSLIALSHKKLLWSFCQPWLCKVGASAEEIADDREKFLDLALCWLPVAEVHEHVFKDISSRPSAVAIQLEFQPQIPEKFNSDIPLRWQTRATFARDSW